jgi:hypothetical protein
MKNTDLENTMVEVLNATTQVNSMSKSSRITGSKIKIGAIIHKRNDGTFYENIEIEGQQWRPFLRKDTNNIELSNMENIRAKSITINFYKTTK